MRKPIMALLAAVGVAMASGSAWSAGPIVLKMGHFIPPDSSYMVAVNSVPARIAKATGDAVKIELHSSLVKPPELSSAVRDGRLDLVAAVHGFMSGTAPALSAGELPGLFRDADDYKKALDAFLAQELTGIWDRQFNARVLALGAFDRMVILAKKPLRTVDDFKGLKIRVPSAVASQLMNALGAKPVQLAFAEIAPALSSGVVDAVLTDAGVSHGMGFHNIAKTINVWRSGVVSWGMVVNKDKWSQLPPAVRQAMEAEFKAIERDHFANYAKHSDGMIAAMVAKGMTLVEPTREEIAKMYSDRYTKAIYDSFAQQSARSGTDGRKTVLQVRQVLQQK
jgi:TRAP-type transport system periplasmic protein